MGQVTMPTNLNMCLFNTVYAEKGIGSRQSFEGLFLIIPGQLTPSMIVNHEKVKNDVDWTGPSAADFDRKSFAETFKVARSDIQNAGSSSQEDTDDYLSEVELSLYWATKGILFYESKRVPLYDKSTGEWTSAPPAEVLLAQCFNRVYHSYYEEVLIPTASFNDRPDKTDLQGTSANTSLILDKTTGTRVSRWLEARTIDATPSISDKSALDFFYSNLPGKNGNERDLMSALQSVQGAQSVVTIARYWAVNYPEPS